MEIPEVWTQTYRGVVFDLQSPTPEMVEARDIAHALSLQCRFTGHTPWSYSVAQHSIYCALMVPQPAKLHALLHDAHEAYTSDLSRPMKTLVGPSYDGIADRIQAAIEAKFKVARHPEIVKQVDEALLATERDEMMGETVPWELDAQPFDLRITRWAPEVAEALFIDLLDGLSRRGPYERCPICGFPKVGSEPCDCIFCIRLRRCGQIPPEMVLMAQDRYRALLG